MSEQGQDVQQADRDERQREQLAFRVAEKVHDAAFRLLDELDELDGALAGEIAKAVQDVVERELRHVL